MERIVMKIMPYHHKFLRPHGQAAEHGKDAADNLDHKPFQSHAARDLDAVEITQHLCTSSSIAQS